MEAAARDTHLKAAFADDAAAKDLAQDDRQTSIRRLLHDVMSYEASAPCSASRSSSGASTPKHQHDSTGSALSLSVVPEFSSYGPAGQTMRAVVSLKAAQEAAARAEIALTCVLDRSGSMQGPLIGLMQETIHFLIDQLTDNDYLGLVSYASDVTEDLPLMRMTPAAKRTAHAIVDALRADGGTALYDGLARGVAQQMASEAELACSKVVHACFLCTDGQANTGPRDADTIIPSVQELQRPTNQNITVHTFGFGRGHSVPLLQSIADAQSGTYYYVAKSSDVPTAYGDALGGLLSAVAKSVKLTMEPLGGARLLGVRTGGRLGKEGADPSQPAPPAGSSSTVSFNDIFAEETRESLLQLQLPADAAMGCVPAACVRLSYVDAATGARVEQVTTLCVARANTNDNSNNTNEQQRQAPNELVYVTAARFETVDAIEAAQRSSDFAAAQASLDAHVERLSAGPVQTAAVSNLVEQVKMVRATIKPRFQFNQESIAMVSSSAQALRQQRSSSSLMMPSAGGLQAATQSIYDSRAKVEWRIQMTMSVHAALQAREGSSLSGPS